MPREDTQFKKGNKGGPGRPPKEKCIPDLLRRFGYFNVSPDLVDELKTYIPELPDKLTMYEAAIARVWVSAAKGDSWGMEFVANRTEGKASAPDEVKGQMVDERLSEIADAIARVDTDTKAFL